MTRIRATLLALSGIVVSAIPMLAQSNASGAQTTAATGASRTEARDSSKQAAPTSVAKYFAKTVPGTRPYDQRGVNMFEAAKPTPGAFTGPSLDLGAAFSQSFQNLQQSNAAAPKIVNGKDQNKLITIGAGLPLASANLVLNAQVANGIVVSAENYLASRGHEQFYVKGGYLQIDASPINVEPLNALMKYTTVKVGMFENNFGDTHFRRSDAGQAMYNPFVGNLIVDPFTTEAGAEVYLRNGSIFGDGRGDQW